MKSEKLIKWALAAFSITAAIAATAQSTPGESEEVAHRSMVRLSLLSPTVVSVCDATGSEAKRCVTANMPKRAGKTDYMVEGNFIRGFPLSWIAISGQRASVCSFVPKSIEIKCMRVKSSIPKGFKVAVYGQYTLLESLAGNVGHGKFVDSINETENLVDEIYLAGEKLRPLLRPVETESEGSSSSVSLMSACDYFSDLDWGSGMCEGGGYGDYYGGEVSDFGTKCVVSGPVITCSTKREPPPGADPVEWYTPPKESSSCSLFGLFCSEKQEPFIPPIKTPEEEYREKKQFCLDSCWTVLPTNGGDGVEYEKCMTKCMTEWGYPGR